MENKSETYAERSKRNDFGLLKMQIFISAINKNKSHYQIVTLSHGRVPSYSVASIGVNRKPHQTNSQYYQVTQLGSISTRSTEGRDLCLTEIISHSQLIG